MTDLEAERLRAEVAQMTAMAEEALAEVKALRAEIDRLREALHFYADRHEYPSDGPWGINSTDFGNVARAALEGRKDG